MMIADILFLLAFYAALCILCAAVFPHAGVAAIDPE